MAGIGFLLAAGEVWLLKPPHSFAIAPALICVAVLAVATMVRLETPFGVVPRRGAIARYYTV